MNLKINILTKKKKLLIWTFFCYYKVKKNTKTILMAVAEEAIGIFL